MTINENLMFEGIQNKLLKHIIYRTITPNIIENYLKSYITISYNETDRHFERKSKRPFTKWYVKKYHDAYKIKQQALKELISHYLKINDNKQVSELKNKLKQLNKESKEIKNKIKLASGESNLNL